MCVCAHVRACDLAKSKRTNMCLVHFTFIVLGGGGGRFLYPEIHIA